MSESPGGPWSVQFRRERQALWTELEQIVVLAEKRGLKQLGAKRLVRLPQLYRATLSSLSVARAAVLDRGLLDYLETLARRAYLVVYAPQRSLTQVLVPFCAQGFPVAVRAIAWHVVVAAMVLVLGATIAFTLVAADLENYYLFVPDDMSCGRDPTTSTELLREMLFDADPDDQPLLAFAAFLFTHNSTIGIMTFGLGFVFGLPVVLLLLYNGMLLGAMTALYHERGLAVEWWSWILPHGVTELLAIVLCGAAGLAVGQAVVFGGVGLRGATDRLTRLDSLAVVGRRMGAVVAGSVAMLLLAGVIEGVFRQVVQGIGVRYGVATMLALLWVGYFGFAGRRTS